MLMPSIPLPAICAPTLTASAKRAFDASPATLYDAWTTGFELWFAQPGTLSMEPQEARAWFFYNRDDWGRHPHYGRFLKLKPHQTVETTWVTGNGQQEGTCGAETVLRIDLIPSGEQTLLKLHQTGFVSEHSRNAHAENWPLALHELANVLAAKLASGDA